MLACKPNKQVQIFKRRLNKSLKILSEAKRSQKMWKYIASWKKLF